MKGVLNDLMKGKALAQAQKDNGYSESVWKHKPKRMMTTGAWQMLLDHALPDEELLKIHAEALFSKQKKIDTKKKAKQNNKEKSKKSNTQAVNPTTEQRAQAFINRLIQ